MNFFENQASARRNTKYLIILYLIAVLLIITFVYLAIVIIWYLSIEDRTNLLVINVWQPDLFTAVAGIISCIVTIGTGYKVLQLRSGGTVVAEALGGKKILPNTTAPDERRVLNIVEEMALASGIQVPQVYILDQEKSINAFAAGYKPNQAVIGISRGCIDQLTRDELQGVVAHEYSHILNGDMRLNIKLIGILHGILVLVLIGRYIFETGLRSNSSRSDKKGNAAPFIMLGLVIVVVGSIGAFAAKLIKMGVSRQREFLADASAVQFTRSPWGLSGALKKIGASAYGSKLQSSKAEEVSHMCFANALKNWFSNVAWLSTHPPLLSRIKAIEPSFDGNFQDYVIKDVATTIPAQSKPAANILNKIPGLPNIPGIDSVIASLGNLTPQALERGAEIKAILSEHILTAAHEPMDACALICKLLVSESKTPAAKQIEILKPKLPTLVAERLEYFHRLELGVLSEHRLNILELCLASMRMLSNAQYLQVKAALQELINHDQEVTVFEYSLYKILTHNLDQHFSPASRKVKEIKDLKKIVVPTTKLLFSLANFGHQDLDQIDQAFNNACDYLGIDHSIRSATKAKLTTIDINTLDLAVSELTAVTPQVRQKIFKACLCTIITDQVVNTDEYDLIRVIGALLECPVPARL